MKKLFLLSLVLLVFISCKNATECVSERKIQEKDLIGTPVTNPDLMLFLEQHVPEIRDGRQSYHYNYVSISGLEFTKGIPWYTLNEGTFIDLIEDNQFNIKKYTNNKSYPGYTFRISEYTTKNMTKTGGYDSYVSTSATKLLSSSRAVATVMVNNKDVITKITVNTSSHGGRVFTTSRSSSNCTGITIYYKEFKDLSQAKECYNSFTNDKDSLMAISKQFESCPLADVYYCCPSKMQVFFEYPYVVAIYDDNGKWSKEKLGF